MLIPRKLKHSSTFPKKADQNRRLVLLSVLSDPQFNYEISNQNGTFNVMAFKTVEPTDNSNHSPIVLWSMGHSNFEIDEFIDLVKLFNIEVIADVRSVPFSRYTPHFNKELLQRSLERAAIGYCFMGDSLGGRPPEPELYDSDGHVLYSELSSNFRFKAGIEDLCIRAGKSQVAMMCSEESPEKCHRRLLISRVLSDQGVETRHIRGNKSLQSDQELIEQFGPQMTENLFGREPWRSIQPVLRSGQLNNSSES